MGGYVYTVSWTRNEDVEVQADTVFYVVFAVRCHRVATLYLDRTGERLSIIMCS